MLGCRAEIVVVQVAVQSKAWCWYQPKRCMHTLLEHMIWGAGLVAYRWAPCFGAAHQQLNAHTYCSTCCLT